MRIWFSCGIFETFQRFDPVDCVLVGQNRLWILKSGSSFIRRIHWTYLCLKRQKKNILESGINGQILLMCKYFLTTVIRSNIIMIKVKQFTFSLEWSVIKKIQPTKEPFGVIMYTFNVNQMSLLARAMIFLTCFPGNIFVRVRWSGK